MNARQILSITLLLLAFLTQPVCAQNHSLSGRVVLSNSGEPASFAQISIDELELRTLCDIDGRFTLNGLPAGKRILRAEYIGYASGRMMVDLPSAKPVIIKLNASNFALKGVEVMAKRTQGGKVRIGQTALEYIQPTSLADVFLLLPGSVYKENDMTQFSQTSARQVGTDANTSMGFAVVADGAPVIEDGTRAQMIGITRSGGPYDSEIATRSGLNQGTDMRYFSTDHIQSVEYTPGIASARYGNLSSGMLNIQSKHGVGPFRARIKSDLKNTLLYAGKGFRLGEHTGTLHVGADYLHSINDPREQMDKFERITAQAYYNNRAMVARVPIDIDVKLSQTLTINKMKRDELTQEYDEDYKADYSRTGLMLKGVASLGKPWLHKAELMLNADFTRDKISRHKLVLSSSGPMNVPMAYAEGEHEGVYLPGKYYSDYYVMNKPLNIVAQLNLLSRLNIWDGGNANIQYGIEYTDIKNHGKGAVVKDPTRPPFPYDNSYMRPRPNYSVPALRNGACYFQTDLVADGRNYKLLFQAGVRAISMMNLPSDYYLHNKVMPDPRLNLSFSIGRRFKNTLRIGYGQQTKLPTLDYLYPEKVYKDFYMLNAYTDNPAYRHLITYTNIFDITNRNLRANCNRKFEAGWETEYAGVTLSFTAFYERSKRGYEFFTTYSPLTYDLYTTLRPGLDTSNRHLEKSDYIKESYSLFTTTTRVENSSDVTKRGIEYRLTIPQIEIILTSFEINGAYYQTDYASSLPLQYYPAVKIGGKEYPYVGIYDNHARNRYRRLNTNIWANTHISSFRLMITNFVQMIWLNTSQYNDNHRYTPQSYMDLQGNVHAVDATMLNAINADFGTERYLKRTIMPINYARNERPFSLLWNIKATKEFGRGTKVSFFVNRIVDVSPKYLSGSKKTRREWNDPYFGLEIFFNFNL